MLADLVTSLGLFTGDLERSLLDELYLDLECLDDLEDLLDLDLPLGWSLPPELDWWRLALDGDLETEESILIHGSLLTENIQKGI